MKPRQITSRYLSALLLTVLYLAISLSPLAQVGLSCQQFASAATEGQAGSGRDCGCPKEKQASHTCCCSQRQQPEPGQGTSAGCCTKKTQGKVAVVSCCPCGPGKTLVPPNLAKDDLIQFAFDVAIANSLVETPAEGPARPMPTRLEPPPVPPPQANSVS